MGIQCRWVLTLAALSLLLANGKRLHERRVEPLVNPNIIDFESGAAAAKIGSLKAKAAAAASRAKAGAAQASTSKTYIERLLLQNKMKEQTLTNALGRATLASANAQASSKAAVASAKEVKKLAKSEVEEAKVLAVEEVQKMLTKSFHDLSEWRETVLSNPYDKAKAAGAAAAKPYFDMIKQFYTRIQEYQHEASGLMSQANSASANSQSLASGAQGRANGGDVIGANQDLETAKALRAQGAQLAGAANTLQGEAKNMNNMISEYMANAHMAAWRAEYAADRDVLPAPPNKPNFAYTPPPPS